MTCVYVEYILSYLFRPHILSALPVLREPVSTSCLLFPGSSMCLFLSLHTCPKKLYTLLRDVGHGSSSVRTKVDPDKDVRCQRPGVFAAHTVTPHWLLQDQCTSWVHGGCIRSYSP